MERVKVKVKTEEENKETDQEGLGWKERIKAPERTIKEMPPFRKAEAFSIVLFCMLKMFCRWVDTMCPCFYSPTVRPLLGVW